MNHKQSLVAAAWANFLKEHEERVAKWHACRLPEGYTLEDFEKELARNRDALNDAYALRPGDTSEMTGKERQDRWEILRVELDRLEYEAGLEYLARQLQCFDPTTPKQFGESYWEHLNRQLEFYRGRGLVVGCQWDNLRNEIRDRGREALKQQRMKREGQHPEGCAEGLPNAVVTVECTTPTDPPEVETSEQAKAKAFYVTLAAIDPDTIKPDFIDRNTPNKELAAVMRKLFKSLGLKGISVAAPRGARGVGIQVPRGDDHKKVDAILYNAFPNCRDRSNTNIDEYDYRWTVSLK